MKNTWEHISFKVNWKLSGKAVNLLGQCYAYINSMLNIPIRPDYHYCANYRLLQNFLPGTSVQIKRRY